MVFINLLKFHSMHIHSSDSEKNVSQNFCYLQVLTALIMKDLIKAVL